VPFVVADSKATKSSPFLNPDWFVKADVSVRKATIIATTNSYAIFKTRTFICFL